MKHQHRIVEKGVAIMSFVAAVVFAFTALIIDEQHELAAGNCTIVAQFLLLTASLFGIDYKLNSIDYTNHKHPISNGNARS